MAMVDGTEAVISDRDLLKVRVDALFIHDDRGRITTTNEPLPDRRQAPRFYLGRCVDGSLWRFRDDMPKSVCAELGDLAASEPASQDFRCTPTNSSSMVEMLASQNEIERIYFGPAFRFKEHPIQSTRVIRIDRANRHLLEPSFSWLITRYDSGGPCFVIIADGIAVSSCWSSRSSEVVCEAGVETLSEYRGRGYATSVLGAWAGEVNRMGRVPRYSTWWENTSSLSLARSLKLVMYGTDFHIT